MDPSDSNDPSPRPRVRALLAQRLSTPEEFDAFCLDYFPAVKSRFAGGMDRLARENLLLEMQTPEEVRAALTRHAGPRSQTRRKLGRWGLAVLVPLVGVVVWHFLNPLLSPLPAVTVSTAFKVTPLTSDASLTGVQADDPMEFAARAQRFQSSARIEAKVRVSAGGREKEVTVILVDEKSSKPISFTHYVSPITLAWTNSLSPNARVLFQIIDRQIQRDTGSFLDKVRPDREASRLQEPENEGAEEQPGRLPPAVGTKDAELPAQAEQLFQGGRDSFGKSDYAKAKKQLEKARALCARDHKHAQACAGLLLETSILLGKIYESQNDLPQAMNAFQHVAKYTVNVRGKNEQKAYALAAIARLRPHLGQVIVTQRNKSGCHQEVNWLHPGTTYVRLNGSLQSVSVKAGGITNIGSCQ